MICGSKIQITINLSNSINSNQFGGPMKSIGMYGSNLVIAPLSLLSKYQVNKEVFASEGRHFIFLHFVEILRLKFYALWLLLNVSTLFPPLLIYEHDFF